MKKTRRAGRGFIAAGLGAAVGLTVLSGFPSPSVFREPGSVSGIRAAVLEYRLGENESRVFLRFDGRIWSAVLPAERLIEGSVTGFIRESGRMTGNLKALERAAVRIAGELIPFGRELDRLAATRLIVVPDGILRRLSFEALRLEFRNRSTLLVDRYAVSYASPGVFPKGKRPRGSLLRPSILALSSDVRGHDRLPAACREIRRISRIFAGAGCRVEWDEAAAESGFCRHAAGNWDIIHFAGHGLSVNRTLERTALALRPGGGEDGVLWPGEAARSGVDAELVVLSACRTSGPLSSSILAAGARSVIATLGPVGDESAADLMIGFYSGLKSGRGIPEALREAKRALIRRGYSHPFFWAGFILQGDPEETFLFSPN